MTARRIFLLEDSHLTHPVLLRLTMWTLKYRLVCTCVVCMHNTSRSGIVGRVSDLTSGVCGV